LVRILTASLDESRVTVTENRKKVVPSAKPLEAEWLTGTAGSSKGDRAGGRGMEGERKRENRTESQTKVPQMKLPRTEVFLDF
jgi:hypothetical protein